MEQDSTNLMSMMLGEQRVEQQVAVWEFGPNLIG